jgi:methylase of polypeptide subunit release factors
MIAEAMATLWTVLFCKEVEFFEVVFERDSAQVVGEILSNPPYLSSSGHLIESMVQELNSFRSVSFRVQQCCTYVGK